MNKKNDLSKNQAFLFVPQKSDHIEETILESGELLLTYHARVRPIFSKIQTFLTKRPVKPVKRKIQLDLLGKSVWNLLDGKNNVKKIINEFAARHKVNKKEAEVSVTLFLKSLGKKGLIGMKEP